MSEYEPDWMDDHGVICLLCGGPADERETQPIRADLDEISPALEADESVIRETVRALLATHGEGETHPECFDNAITADRPSGRRTARTTTENY